jgi:hypothetical protein
MLWLVKPLTQPWEFTMGRVIREVWPRCKSATYKKNGHIHNGKQNHQCKDCGRQFAAKAPGSDGARYLRHTVSKRRFIRISTWCRRGSFPLHSTERSTKKHARPITLNALIIPCGNAFHGWCAVRCRSPKSWPTTSVPFNIAFATTT